MNRDDFNALGDRQKTFEGREAARQLMPGLPVLVRLDGRAFHTFTRGLARPYDVRFRRAMTETAKFLVDESHASIGYTQSDEISLVFPNTVARAQMFFDGKVQKLCSVLASLATAKFNQQVGLEMPEKADLLPVFDARAWAVPSLTVAAEHFIWREADATRNSLSMAASAVYSAKELHKAGFVRKHEMLHAKGINWADYPAFFKRGTYVRREAVERTLSDAELAKIPERHRPTGPIIRSVLTELDMPPLLRIENLHAVLFFGEAPMPRAMPADAAASDLADLQQLDAAEAETAAATPA